MAPLIAISLTGLALSSCTKASHIPPAHSTKVLGQQAPDATVIGQPAPAGTGELGAVSCADALHCWAVGVAGPNATTTAAPVTVIAATANGGLTWSAQPLSLPAPPELSGIACPTTRACIAVGSTGVVPGAGIVLTTRDGGRTWAAATVPTGAFVLASVTCSAVTLCTAITSDGTNTWSAQTTDFAQTWTQEGNLPAGFSNPRALFCTATATCLVAGYSPTTTGHGRGAIVISADGGQTWASATVPPNAGVLQDATCPTASTCLAVGTTSTTVSDVVPATGQELASADGGRTWTFSAFPPPVDDVYGVACPTSKICAIVGTNWVGQPAIGSGGVAHSADGGVTYGVSKSAYVPLTLTALDCPTSTACIAVGGNTVARISLPPPVSGVTPNSFRRAPVR
jgi:photosystem II stability/assembly factor-like uncharacterized protein